MKGDLTRRYVTFLVKRRHACTAVLFVLTLLSIFSLYQKGRIFTNFFQLYPPGHPYIQTYMEFRKMFGSANVMAICLRVKEGDIFTRSVLSKVDSITRRVLNLPGVNPYQVSSITHPSLKKIHISTFGIGLRPLIEKLPETQEDLDRIRKDVYETEGVRGAYVSPDNRSTLIFLGFWEEGVDFRSVWSQVQALLREHEDENTILYATGYPMLYAWIYHSIPRIFLVFALTLAVLTVLLFLNFGTFRGVTVPLLSAATSAVWAFGFAFAMGFDLDPLILVVPVLLMGRTLSHSVQCMERFEEEYKKDSDKQRAVIDTYSELFWPASFSIVTDGLGVLTIAVARIPLMQKLAFMGGFWIITMVVSVLTLQPIVQTYLEATQPTKRLRRRLLNLLDRIGAIGRICSRGAAPKRILAVLVVALVSGFFLSLKLQVGDTRIGSTIFYEDHPYNVGYAYLSEQFWGINELVIILAGQEEDILKDPKILSALEAFRQHMAADPNCGGTVTFLTLIQRLNRMFHDGIPKWEVTPTESDLLAQLLFMVQGNAAPGEMARFFSPDYRNASLILYFKDYSNAIISDAIERAKEFIAQNSLERASFRLAGGLMGIMAAVNEEVRWSYWANLITIFSVIVFICLAVYRSPAIAFILCGPLYLSQVLCDVFMLWRHIDLNINSLPVASIGVGVGIDYGIYMISRIWREYMRCADYDEAIETSLRTTGRAVIFTALTMTAGVIFWVFSGIKFHTEMATLIALLLLLNMLGAMTLVPALVKALKPFKRRPLLM